MSKNRAAYNKVLPKAGGNGLLCHLVDSTLKRTTEAKGNWGRK